MGTEYVADMLKSLDRVGLLDPRTQGSRVCTKHGSRIYVYGLYVRWSLTGTNSQMILNMCPMQQFSTSG